MELDTDDGPASMQIVEAAPDQLRLKSVELGDAPLSYGTGVLLDVPVDGQLRRG